MLRLLIRKTAWDMDRMDHKQIERELSDKVSMCNYWGNRLVCEAADCLHERSLIIKFVMIIFILQPSCLI